MKKLSAIFGILFLAAGQFAGEKTFAPDMERCAAFTSADAGKILNLPASELVHASQKLSPSLWSCSFSGKDKAVTFSVEIAKSPGAAAADMARYREHLELAAETAPFRGKLPQGAWSEILELGDESTWTDINGTLTVRAGNLTLQVQSPRDKLAQIAVAQAFLKKL